MILFFLNGAWLILYLAYLVKDIFCITRRKTLIDWNRVTFRKHFNILEAEEIVWIVRDGLNVYCLYTKHYLRSWHCKLPQHHRSRCQQSQQFHLHIAYHAYNSKEQRTLNPGISYIRKHFTFKVTLLTLIILIVQKPSVNKIHVQFQICVHTYLLAKTLLAINSQRVSTYINEAKLMKMEAFFLHRNTSVTFLVDITSYLLVFIGWIITWKWIGVIGI